MPRLIHITDLYHPHNDPDDHYDLAQVFALGKSGALQVQQVIIDYPKLDDIWAPALGAVYQLNALTKSNVHVTVGTDPRIYAGKPELWASAPKEDVWAAEAILDILRTCEEKVFISIAGGCLDTAIALAREPELFREKCAGILLNAGSGIPTEEKEWNVTLGPLEYSKLFEAPCPLYWCPCMHSMDCLKGRFGTLYELTQQVLWKQVSPELVNYFLYALTRTADPLYLQYLTKPADEEARAHFGALRRGMFCTAGLFEAAGLTVTADGEIVSKGKTDSPVYSFRPVRVTATAAGETDWQFDSRCTDRLLFCINDTEKYEAAMTKALTSILAQI